MPFVTVRVVKGSLNQEKKAKMIAKVSEAVAEVEADPYPKEKILPYVWCQIVEMDDGNFGAGGNIYTIDNLKKRLSE